MLYPASRYLFHLAAQHSNNLNAVNKGRNCGTFTLQISTVKCKSRHDVNVFVHCISLELFRGINLQTPVSLSHGCFTWNASVYSYPPPEYLAQA